MKTKVQGIWSRDFIPLPLCKGNMTICSPETGIIARGRSQRIILPVEGEQIVMLPSHKGNDCFIVPFLNNLQKS